MKFYKIKWSGKSGMYGYSTQYKEILNKDRHKATESVT